MLPLARFESHRWGSVAKDSTQRWGMGATTLKLEQGAAQAARVERKALSDSEIVQRFLDGDERAFGDLVERYDRRLLNFVFRTVGDRERAQDLVQETFVRVYRHLHRFDQTKKFSTWIYTIAGNLAKNELRNRSRSPLVLFQKHHEELGRRSPASRVGRPQVQAGRPLP